MRTDAERFRINDEGVAAEVVHGEAVILNLLTGAYYSLDVTSTDVWTALTSGRRVADVGADLAGVHGVSVEQATADVGGFLEELIREGLVVETDASHPAEAAPPAGATDKPRYAAPRLTKHTDMVDMLALDPPLPGLKDMPWRKPAAEEDR